MLGICLLRDSIRLASTQTGDPHKWQSRDEHLVLLVYCRMLQEKLDQPISSPPSPRDLGSSDIASHLSQNISTLRQEVNNLRNQLVAAQAEREYQ